MKPTFRQSIGQKLSQNRKLDKKALELKKSWDEVSNIVNTKNKKKK